MKQSALFEQLERNLPPGWFRQLRRGEGSFRDLLWGLAGVLAKAQISIEAARRQAIPATSGGFWLSLHLLGLGLQRRAGETDAAALRRYQLEFSPTRNTREGLLTLARELSGVDGQVRLETDFANQRFGELCIVTESFEPWQERQWWWVGDLFGKYVANGVQPLLDLRACNLRHAPFEHYWHHTQFPMGFNQLGPAWERPGFISPLSLDFARNQVAFLRPDSWAEDIPRLEKLFRDSGDRNPGAQFFYLAEGETPCSQNLEIDYQPPEIFSNDGSALVTPPFEVFGWQFDDMFPRQGAQIKIEIGETVSFRVLGLGPDDAAVLAAYDSGDPGYRVPGEAWSTASADYRVDSSNYFTGSIELLTERVVVPGYPFGMLPWFAYQSRFEDVAPVTESVIADYAVVPFEIPQFEDIKTEFWRRRGSYVQPNTYSLPSVDEWITSAQSSQGLPQETDLSGTEVWDDLTRWNDSVAWADYPSVLEGQATNMWITPEGGFKDLTGTGEWDDAATWSDSVPWADDISSSNQLTGQSPDSWFKGTPIFVDNSELQVADFQEFSGYSFICNADAAITQTQRIQTGILQGFIPNARTIFTDGRIIRWLEVTGAIEGSIAGISALESLGLGPWVLRLGSGSPLWEDSVPGGIGELQQEFAALSPSSVWWTDEAGTSRSPNPQVFGEDAISYLCLEFLLPAASARLLRELELRFGYEQPTVVVEEGEYSLEGTWILPEESNLVFPVDVSPRALNTQLPILDIVHYRRMDVDVPEHVNLGVIVRIATRLGPAPETIDYPAFRAGSSRMGDPLRDLDYVLTV